ncbi:MAG: PKD domain-containing protein [Bacteroidota bacterium]
MKQLLWTLMITLMSGLACLHSQTFFYLEEVQISPTAPSPTDEVMVTLSGLKSTPCAFQESTDIYVVGDQANIDMCWNDTAACIAVLDPWAETYSLGNLNAGNYTLNLGGCNHSGIGNTYTFSVSGQVAPTALFELSTSSGCSPVTVDFTNLSTNADTYFWDFGGEGSSTMENPSFTFVSNGTFQVTLEATNAGSGETALFVLEEAVTVYPVPLISLGPDVTINENESVTLNPGTGFTTYEWSDNSTGEELVFAGSQNGPGTYTISVTVTDTNGCTGSASINITVEEGPNSVFTPQTAATTLMVSPNPTTSDVVLQGWPSDFAPQQVQVYLSNGQQMKVPSFQMHKGGVQIDLSNYPSGLLWVVLLDSNGQQLSARIIKQ